MTANNCTGIKEQRRLSWSIGALWRHSDNALHNLPLGGVSNSKKQPWTFLYREAPDRKLAEMVKPYRKEMIDNYSLNKYY